MVDIPPDRHDYAPEIDGYWRGGGRAEKERVQGLMLCQAAVCKEAAVALSLLGFPVCLRHGQSLGGCTLMPLVWEFVKQLKAKGVEVDW